MSAPLVSAVITTYKRSPAMLLEAVESARSQTYRPLEILVVSDNPPDGEHARAVADALRPFPDVRLMQMARNSGAQAARNAGIRAAAGEFIALLDDDDLWLPEKTAMQMPAFSDPRVGLVYCRGSIFRDDVRDLQEYYSTQMGFRTGVRFAQMLGQDYIGSTSQAIVRRRCFEDCGFFDERFRARQDYDRWLSILRRYRAVGIDAPLFLHRIHGEGRITDSLQVSLRSYVQIYEKYRWGYIRHPAACSRQYRRRALLEHRLGLRQDARRHLVLALLWCPPRFLSDYFRRRALPKKGPPAAQMD